MSDSPIREEVRVPEGISDSRAPYVAYALMETLPSRASAKKACKRGQLLLDGELVRWDTRVVVGQVLTLLEPHPRGIEVFERTLNVVYEDAIMAVVEKPPGLTVNGYRLQTFENALPYNLEPTVAGDALNWPRPAHRLDARTQGLVLVAKTSTALVGLNRSFQERRVWKHYKAILRGRLEGEGIVDEPLQGREAVTRYAVVEHTRSLKAEWTTTVDLWPKTGRTHQLRIHMAHLGHPVLGDGRYGDGFRGSGLFLQAAAIRFDHPLNGAAMHISIPEAPKFGSYRTREARRWAKYNEPDSL